MTKNLLLALACCLLATSACNIIYKQNIQQGNALEQDKLDQLKLGMTMNQVAFLLGTPSIRDPFHHNRWDYLSSFSRRGGKPITRLVTLKFENAILREITGVNPDAPGETQSGDDTASEDSAEEGVKDEIQAAPVVAQQPEEPVITAIDTPASEHAESSGANTEMPGPASEMPAEAESDASDNGVMAEEAPEEIVEDTAQETADQNPQAWMIQLGAFDAIENARNLVKMLRDAGFEASVSNHEVAGLGTRYLVRTEEIDTHSEAEQQLRSINSAFDLGGFLIPPSD